MTDNLRESISALMDDEAHEAECHSVLSRMQHDDQVRNTWTRYQKVSRAIRREATPLGHVDISDRIASAIASEETHSVSVQNVVPMESSWKRPFISVAMAASVAFMVVFGALTIRNDEVIQEGLAPLASNNVNSEVPVDSAQVKLVSETLSDQDDAAFRDRVERLMQEHEQQAAASRGSSFMPYARAVSYDKK